MEKLELKKTRNPIPYSEICPICHGNGFEYYKDSEGRDMGRECSCGALKRRLHNKRLSFANIPESFIDVRLENFKKSVYQKPDSQKKIIDVAKAIKYWLKNIDKMKNFGIGLYIYSGTRGTGKTRLAVSIANELIEKYNMHIKFATSLKILEEIKKTWNRNNQKDKETENELLLALKSTEILIIDDFGVEEHKGWIDDKFYSIINERYNDKKITIFTSNFSIDDLPYDPRTTSRIKERTLQIPFPEESVREYLSQQLQQELKENMESKKREEY